MQFSTGDLILFSGNSNPHLRVQQFVGSKWSQVGLIVNYNGKNAILESTKLPICKDIDTNTFVSGVQVISLSEKIEKFDGVIAVRKLQGLLNETQKNKLMQFIHQVKGKPFNDSKYFMVRGRDRRNPESDNSSFLCSQLVAEALQQIKVIKGPPVALTSSNYSPADFSSERTLLMQPDFSFGIEQYIKPYNLKT